MARGRHGSRCAAQRAAAAAFLAAPPERCVPPITGFTYMAPTGRRTSSRTSACMAPWRRATLLGRTSGEACEAPPSAKPAARFNGDALLCPCARTCAAAANGQLQSALERVFSMRRFHVRCCFIPDVAPGNCCGTMVAARSSDDLWEHLQTVHGVGRDAYMVRARALQWGV